MNWDFHVHSFSKFKLSGLENTMAKKKRPDQRSGPWSHLNVWNWIAERPYTNTRHGIETVHDFLLLAVGHRDNVRRRLPCHLIDGGTSVIFDDLQHGFLRGTFLKLYEQSRHF